MSRVSLVILALFVATASCSWIDRPYGRSPGYFLLSTELLLAESSSEEESTIKDVICPDKQSECPDRTTCCILASGGYGCCPMPNAVCCTDHIHCCPTGATCDLKTQTCDQNGVKTALLLKTPSKKIAEDQTSSESSSSENSSSESSSEQESTAKDVICPDKQSECPDRTTCCILASGGYGCCPMPNAVCCTDHIHCCPNGATCDLKRQTCNQVCVPRAADISKLLRIAKVLLHKNGIVTPLLRKLAANKLTYSSESSSSESSAEDLSPSSESSSSESSSEDLSPSSENSSSESSLSESSSEDPSPSSENSSSESSSSESSSEEESTATLVMCPDNKSACPDGTTCCLFAVGKYGCCPIPNAICCIDHIHCCPHGNVCDMKKKTCDKNGVETPLLRKTISKQIDARQSSSKSSSEYSSSESSSHIWSSEISSDSWSSESTSEASENSLSESTSEASENSSSESSSSESSSEEESTIKDVICPDKQSECPDRTTCCILASGGYGCCPMPNAVCCTDHIHCCPTGATCDLKTQTCDQNGIKTPLLRKLAAEKVTMQQCGDGISQCPESSTCCILSNGRYGCCPARNAVCCSDKIHCCPERSTCDLAHGQCLQGNGRFSMLLKRKTTMVIQPNTVKLRDIVCPDRKSICPSGTTCCRLSSGAYGCCPHEKAVCCADHLHCCPANTQCDVEHQKCLTTRNNFALHWTSIHESNSEAEQTCDDGSRCPASATCCRNPKGHHFSCCPVQNGVCCGTHCCPNGYHCAWHGHGCLKNMKQHVHGEEE